MTKKITTKAMVMSLVSMFLTLVMFVGVTYAWYTDSTFSAGNVVSSGELSAKMYWSSVILTANESAWIDVEASTPASNPIFSDSIRWEPGCTYVRYLKFENTGDLAFKYQFDVIPDLDSEEALKLSKVIDMYYRVFPGDTVEALLADTYTTTTTYAGSLYDVIKGTSPTGGLRGTLLPKTDTSTSTIPKGCVIVALALHMREDAGSEYQKLSVGSTGFKLRLLASQYTYETDSFTNQYDVSYPVVNAAVTSVSAPPTEDIILGASGAMQSATVPQTAAAAIYSSMAVVGADSNKLSLTLNLQTTGKTTTPTGTTVDLQIDMLAVMTSTTGGVTTSSTNTISNFDDQYITINYNLGPGLQNVAATHSGSAMVNSADTSADAGHGVFTYNSESGILTIQTKTLSPFSVFYGLSDAQRAVADGLTVLDTTATYAVAQDPETKVIYKYKSDRKIYIKSMSEYTGTSFTIPENVDGISDSAFWETSVTSITINHNLEYAWKAFCGSAFTESNSTLTSVTLGPNVTEIPARLFCNCTALTSFTIPETVTTIGEGAFRQSGLTSLTVPATVKTIGRELVAYCPNLVTLTFEGPMALGQYTARACAKLKHVYFYSSEITFAASQQFTNDENGNDNSQITIHVIDEAVANALWAVQPRNGMNSEPIDS